MGKAKREMLSNSYDDVYFSKVAMKLVCEALKRTLTVYIYTLHFFRHVKYFELTFKKSMGTHLFYIW